MKYMPSLEYNIRNSLAYVVAGNLHQKGHILLF